jgi:hypothetical protein
VLGNEACRNVGAHGFWKRGRTTIFDIQVCDTDDKSYGNHDLKRVLEGATCRKKNNYEEVCLERRQDFTPMIYLVDGMADKHAGAAEKRIAGILMAKCTHAATTTPHPRRLGGERRADAADNELTATALFRSPPAAQGSERRSGNVTGHNTADDASTGNVGNVNKALTDTVGNAVDVDAFTGDDDNFDNALAGFYDDAVLGTQATGASDDGTNDDPPI